MGITDFFQKKETQKPTVPLSENELKETVLKEKLLRQQVKTVAAKPGKTAVKPKIVTKAKKGVQITKKPAVAVAPLVPFIPTFYGKTVRKVYYQNHWYFFLEDVVAVGGSLGLEETILKLKQTEEYKKNFSKYIISLPVVENEATKNIECVDGVGATWLLPQVRSDERVFPGPFPEWLKETSLMPGPVTS